MSLTATEVTFANKLLTREEQAWRNWAIVRWLVLLVGLVILLTGATMVWWGQRLPEETAAVRTGHATQDALVSHAVIEGEVVQTRNELIAFSLTSSLLTSFGVGLMATGLVAGAFGLTHWNAHLRDQLLCKALREKFGSELQMPGTPALG
ncbi:MAG: hypothetical protein WCI73_12695 [Phycisphaerae bacterium]